MPAAREASADLTLRGPSMNFAAHLLRIDGRFKRIIGRLA
jgi:hypothetical protein